MTDPIPATRDAGDTEQTKPPAVDRANEPPSNLPDTQGDAQPQPAAHASRTHSTSRHPHPNRTSRRLLPADLSREEAVRRLETFYRLTRLVAESNNDADRLVHDAARLISEVLGYLTVIPLLNVHGET